MVLGESVMRDRSFLVSTKSMLRDFWRDEQGGPGVEYALLVSVIVAFIIAGAGPLGGAITDSIVRAADILGAAMT
jgi:Flp pilus assembly pilin Flp